MKTLKFIDSKIYNLDNIQKQLKIWHSESKKIVFTNGCFDILHLGHITYLSKSRDLGDILIVGVNSDKSPYWLTKNLRVTQKKWALPKSALVSRPINNQHSRAMILGSLSFVDAVVFFSEETPLKLIKIIKPDVLVKGEDYNEEDIVGYDVVMKNGGEVKTIDMVDGFSTTNIIKKMK